MGMDWGTAHTDTDWVWDTDWDMVDTAQDGMVPINLFAKLKIYRI